MEQQDEKRQKIVDAALKRFAHFGLNKTTMSDIAGDLNFSKALLYYYFPDKLNLYAAVLEKVFAEITETINSSLKNAKTPELATEIYIDARKGFLEKYFPILDFNKFVNIEKYLDLKKLLEKSNQSEIGHIKSIIQIGVDTGKYKVDDIGYIAQLLFDVILGVRILHIKSAQVQFGIDKDFLNMISNRQKEIMSIFLRGLEQ